VVSSDHLPPSTTAALLAATGANVPDCWQAGRKRQVPAASPASISDCPSAKHWFVRVVALVVAVLLAILALFIGGFLVSLPGVRKSGAWMNSSIIRRM